MVLALVGIDFIVKDFTEKTLVISKPRKRAPAWQVLLMAGLIGILSGVLANGGGIFFVRAFVVFFRLHPFLGLEKCLNKGIFSGLDTQRPTGIVQKPQNDD